MRNVVEDVVLKGIKILSFMSFLPYAWTRIINFSFEFCLFVLPLHRNSTRQLVNDGQMLSYCRNKMTLIYDRS